MWTTTIKHLNSLQRDNVSEISHDFGNGVTVVTNFEEGTTRQKHGEITVAEFDIIRDTEKYTNFLNNLQNEINP